jgi:recombination protein RecA
METLIAKKMRLKTPSKKQLGLVIGSLLGDGYLAKTTRGYAFRVNHGLNQISYVNWKYEILAPFIQTKPKAHKSCYYFRTISHPIFLDLHKKFYKGGVKRVPFSLLRGQLNPFILSVWIMDDGSKDGKQLRINSQSFSEYENKCLKELLWAKLGIKVNLNLDKDRFRLRVESSSMEKLIRMITPYIIPSMLYKLPL